MVDLMLLMIQPKGCFVKNASISGRHGLVFQCDFFQNLAFNFQCSATFFDIVPLFFSGQDKIHYASAIM